MTDWDRSTVHSTLGQADRLFDQWMDYWKTQIQPFFQRDDKEAGLLALENIVNISFRISKLHQTCVLENSLAQYSPVITEPCENVHKFGGVEKSTINGTSSAFRDRDTDSLGSQSGHAESEMRDALPELAYRVEKNHEFNGSEIGASVVESSIVSRASSVNKKDAFRKIFRSKPNPQLLPPGIQKTVRPDQLRAVPGRLQSHSLSQDTNSDSTSNILRKRSPTTMSEVPQRSLPAIPTINFQANYFHELDDMSQLNLKREIVDAIENVRLQLFLVQRRALLPLVQGIKDVVIQCPDRSGQTEACVITALQRVDTSVPATQVIIVTPNRSSALKLVQVFGDIGARLNASIYVCNELDAQANPKTMRKLKSHIVIGGPNQLRHLMASKIIDTLGCNLLIVNSAEDLLLGDSLYEILLRVFKTEVQQFVIVGTTISPALLSYCGKYLRDPVCVTVTDKENERLIVRGTRAATIHEYIDVRQESWKMEALRTCFATKAGISLFSNGTPLVVCRNSSDAAIISRILKKSDIAALNLHYVNAAEIADAQARSNLLVLVTSYLQLSTTSLDLKSIQLVVFYDLPITMKEYLLGARQLHPSRKASTPPKILSLIIDGQMEMINKIQHHFEITIKRVDVNSLAVAGANASSAARRSAPRRVDSVPKDIS
ncbi:putative ATP-dependent RNA helicase eIF4A [Hypsibius exemplaris]|uniref:ATP-dependent RNA helicase n=1 Tax=Hypsibius exemplaris TaxID=2072580 RepID=A0A1W0WF32_HYPEX|nr:putative ATP-dependent RNA helicase eIF4A [Hypsibius exemplaris]